MKIKEFNSEKVGFKAVHTENDADILIHVQFVGCLIDGATEFSTHQCNFLS